MKSYISSKIQYTRGKQIAALLRPFWSIRAHNIVNRILPYIQPNSRILDIGAGNGLIAKELMKRGHRTITLLDVIDWNISTLPLILFDGTNIPFSDQQFDVAILVDVIHHSQDEKTLVSEAARVAKRVLIVEETHGKNWANTLANVADNIQFVLYGMPIGHHHRDDNEWLEFLRINLPNIKQVGKYFSHIIFLSE